MVYWNILLNIRMFYGATHILSCFKTPPYIYMYHMYLLEFKLNLPVSFLSGEELHHRSRFLASPQGGCICFKGSNHQKSSVNLQDSTGRNISVILACG